MSTFWRFLNCATASSDYCLVLIIFKGATVLDMHFINLVVHVDLRRCCNGFKSILWLLNLLSISDKKYPTSSSIG
jgi:hypothetical protein